MTQEPTPHQQGYGWLQTRVAAALKTIQGITVAPTSEIAADDQYLHPIRRTLMQAANECLLTALDHLRFVGWSLIERGEPLPYAQFTVVRTAITAGATAMWMLSGDNASERRIRALEFYLNDFKSNVAWIDTVKQQPPYQTAPAPEQKAMNDDRSVMLLRQNLIVQMANKLLNPEKPFTRSTLARRTKDSDMVKLAGAATPSLGDGGYDPAVTLLNTWQTMSGYAHARPWSALRGRQLGAIDPVTGMQSAVQKGDPDQLLDASFRALLVVEEAARRWIALSAS